MKTDPICRCLRCRLRRIARKREQEQRRLAPKKEETDDNSPRPTTEG